MKRNRLREKGYVNLYVYIYIFIYKKHNISYRYKGPWSGVSQSFMYNRRSNSTDSWSLCCDDTCRSALWEHKESRVHPVMCSRHACARVCVLSVLSV